MMCPCTKRKQITSKYCYGFLSLSTLYLCVCAFVFLWLGKHIFFCLLSLHLNCAENEFTKKPIYLKYSLSLPLRFCFGFFVLFAGFCAFVLLHLFLSIFLKWLQNQRIISFSTQLSLHFTSRNFFFDMIHC